MSRDAYATAADVLRHLSHIRPATFTATSQPNLTQVGGHITGVADELDAKLSAQGYSTPVATGATAAWGLLKQWNSVGAAMYVADSQPGGGDAKHLPFLERRWTAILKGIDDGSLKLPGVSKDSTVSHARYGRSATGASPYFTRDFYR